MLESKSGPKILEINSSPGLEGIERATGVDVASAIVAHAERLLARRAKRTKKDDVVEGERRATRMRESLIPVPVAGGKKVNLVRGA
jgi:ribosomal protein S6--L-glutamate ligase